MASNRAVLDLEHTTIAMVSETLQDTSWLDTYIKEIPHIVYQIDDPEDTQTAQTATLANRGKHPIPIRQ